MRRAADGQAVVDASWALANRGDGTFDRSLLIAGRHPAVRLAARGHRDRRTRRRRHRRRSTHRLDVLLPDLFVAILLAELRRPRARMAALLGAGIALALVPFSARWIHRAGCGCRPR